MTAGPPFDSYDLNDFAYIQCRYNDHDGGFCRFSPHFRKKDGFQFRKCLGEDKMGIGLVHLGGLQFFFY